VILVDSSVWIDYFRGVTTPQSDRLDALLGTEPLATGDIVLAEVLQGFNLERDFDNALRLLTSLSVIEIVGQDVAVQAARNFRMLRSQGVTVRKTTDTLIATRCIMSGHALLYSDRDFDPFVAHLNLKSAMAAS
jgi:predicted nucleic acid-binding protein